MEPTDGQHALVTQHVSVHPTPERPTVREGGAIINSYHSLAPDFLRVIHHHIAVCDIDSGRGVDPACTRAGSGCSTGGASWDWQEGGFRAYGGRQENLAAAPCDCSPPLLHDQHGSKAAWVALGTPPHSTTPHHTTLHHTTPHPDADPCTC